MGRRRREREREGERERERDGSLQFCRVGKGGRERAGGGACKRKGVGAGLVSIPTSTFSHHSSLSTHAVKKTACAARPRTPHVPGPCVERASSFSFCGDVSLSLHTLTHTHAAAVCLLAVSPVDPTHSHHHRSNGGPRAFRYGVLRRAQAPTPSKMAHSLSPPKKNNRRRKGCGACARRVRPSQSLLSHHFSLARLLFVLFCLMQKRGARAHSVLLLPSLSSHALITFKLPACRRPCRPGPGRTRRSRAGRRP
jgi:hypothetical protein